MQIKQRVERLEQRGGAEAAIMVVVGDADRDQQQAIEQGKVRVIVRMPDNRRGDCGDHQNPN
ncbi:MAG: hypothetical protein EOM24_37785 [Chloroflexia bacterium]|nr:hypothetical protein [Chloroflexia bacterium]